MNTAVAPATEAVSERRFRALGTSVHLVVTGSGSPSSLLAEAEARVRRCEQRWSRFRPDSELSMLNAAAGKLVVVSADTYQVVADAVAAQRLTNGVFDPTVLHAMLDAGYDRSFENLEHVDSNGKTDSVRPGSYDKARNEGSDTVARPAPGVDAIELWPGFHGVRLPKGTGLDLGGIAKGATVDAVAEQLLAAGAAGCCVNIGGDLRVAGAGPDDGAWGVEVQCPGSAAGDRLAVRLRAGAVCTSSVLRRRWRQGERVEHHLRYPATGAPMESDLVSVTLVGARATQLDVATKVILAAGIAGAPAEAERCGITGVVVDRRGMRHELPGFAPFKASIVDRVQDASTASTTETRP